MPPLRRRSGRGRGRPRSTEEARRDLSFCIRVSAVEEAELVRAAMAEGMTPRTWGRRLLLAAARRRRTGGRR